MTRCSAITKAGKQCSVTSSSNWKNDYGRLVAEPLLKGSEYCLLHAKPFCTKTAQVDDIDRLFIFILDLETTGIDVTKDGIVEIAALHAHGDARMSWPASQQPARSWQPTILNIGPSPATKG